MTVPNESQNKEETRSFKFVRVVTSHALNVANWAPGAVLALNFQCVFRVNSSLASSYALVLALQAKSYAFVRWGEKKKEYDHAQTFELEHQNTVYNPNRDVTDGFIVPVKKHFEVMSDVELAVADLSGL